MRAFALIGCAALLLTGSCKPPEATPDGAPAVTATESPAPVRTVRLPQLSPGPKAQRPVDTVRWAVPLDATSPSRGNLDTPLVTIVLFEDLSSPFSRHLHPTLNALMAASPGDVRLSYRHLPLPHNPQALPAANAAHCAHEQGRFWEMRDALFRGERADLAALPAELGLDLPSFHACLTGPSPKRRVAADALAARRATVGGTPVLFVNGRKSAGAISLEGLTALVEEERAAAKARVASQAKSQDKKAVYEMIMKSGRARSPLAPVPTPIAEAPLTTIGGEEGLISIKAWLDLSLEPHRQSLKALISTARAIPTIALELFPAKPSHASDSSAWSRRLWCAKAQDKLWPMLEAAAAATRHTHGHPTERVVADAEPHHGEDALEEVSRIAGVDPTRCAELPLQAATFKGPTWLINGRRYDGSLGWGPHALRRLVAMVSTAP